MKNGIKILLATDFSDSVMNAERYAIQFAMHTGAQLFMMHVYDLSLGSVPNEPRLFVSYRENLKQSKMLMLEQRRNKLFDSMHLSPDELECECYVNEGHISTEIRNRAKEINADLIIVGTHDVNRLKKIFFGSHASQVIETSNIPVLAVPPHGLFTEIKNIVFATEERMAEIMTLEYLAQFATRFNASINVYHIYNANARQFESKIFEKFKIDVEGLVKYDKLNLHLEPYENAVEGINDVCKNENANLLVLAGKKASLFEKLVPQHNLAGEMSFYTYLPLLVIPESFAPVKQSLQEIVKYK
ncbi:MAG: universal stress protein [Bacteroidia bacterium]